MSEAFLFGGFPPIGGPHPNPLPDPNVNCTINGSVVWVWNVFHECVVTDVQFAGFFFGLASILCWLVVFVPQFYDAYETGHMDEAISPIFLIFWLLGDVSNLTGSILSNQLGTQVVVAYYFIGMDCLVLLQFSYYYFKNRRQRQVSQVLHRSYDSLGKSHSSHIIYCMGGLLLLGSTAWFSLLPWQQPAVQDVRWRGRSLLGHRDEEDYSIICQVLFLDTNDCFFYSNKEIVGYACGCVSAVFYLASRVPQLYKNYKRKSVEGLAIMMFILTVLGNVFYGLSIILEDTSVLFLMRHFPWLVGSLGTLCFDCIMLVQFRLYGRSVPRDLDIEVDVETRGLLTHNPRSDDEGF